LWVEGGDLRIRIRNWASGVGGDERDEGFWMRDGPRVVLVLRAARARSMDRGLGLKSLRVGA